ncbi:MAG: hypothetical protein ACOYMN_12330 [Roseimicrobium sp.]
MARQRPHEEELPFVALMDTMTNVVGVLIIVLVMVGISLANAVKKVFSELPDVSVEQLEKLKREVVDNTPKEDPKKVEDDTRKLEQTLKKTIEELKTLDLSNQKQDVKLLDLDDLRKQLEERRKQRDAKKATTDKLLAEIDTLKALLDTTPVYQPPPPTVVRLPNPRPFPVKAVQHKILVAGGRVIYLNDENFLQFTKDELLKNQKTLQHASSTSAKPVFDHQKTAEWLANRRIATRELRLITDVVGNVSRLRVKLEPLPEAGESVEQVRNPASNFQRMLRKLKEEPTNVLGFLVFKDSIDTYLAAREVADSLGMPATWGLAGTPFLVTVIPDIVVNPLKASTTKPPAAALTIPPPKASLD